ncbi:MAG: LicD family protein [Clostridia bacterium]|nr:LicD family protein [Clostridia bacterium]
MEYLRELQKVETEILDEIVRVCEENELDYFLIGGTLLGAVRHKGFIPWDDDLDIVMPRDSFDRFIRLCQKGCLSEEYYLHSKETDPEYWLIFPKVRKKNTIFDEKNIAHLDVPKGIYVDIFPLDDAKKEQSPGKWLRTKMIKYINAVLCYKKKIPVISRSKKLCCVPFGWMPMIWLSTIQSRLMQMENGKNAEYFVNYGSNYKTVKQTMRKEVYFPPCKLEFEGKLYNCPNDWEYVLKRIFGPNYMQLPPIEKRVTHRPVRICFDTRLEGKNYD